ncbi:MAG: alpha/beta hydrolase-fold protein [Bacteroidales bacterium]
MDTFDITNSDNGYEYTIEVAYPNSKTTDNVVFVLDPSSMMSLANKALNDIAYSNDVALIGIDFKGRNKRNRDYTPTEIGDETGEADAFFNFICGDLHVELLGRDIISGDAEISIIGHSLGGLAVTYAFINHNDYFQNFAVLSPALYWDEYSVLEIEKQMHESNSYVEARIFTGIGIQEELGMQNSYEALNELLRDNYPNVSLKTHIAEGSHLESRSESIEESFKHILD